MPPAGVHHEPGQAGDAFPAPVQAISVAITRTGGVVSSAGLILATTVAVLMTRPIREPFQFDFAMAFGILLDAFLVRPLLVPAVVRLLGDRALWPTRPEAPSAPAADTAEDRLQRAT